MIQNLSIDLETRSSVDIVKSSVYRYAESDDFAILLFGVSVNHGPIRVYDLARGDTVPADILKALTDNTVEKWAYNSSFERVCVPWYWAYITVCPSDWKKSVPFLALRSRN